jgi:hypothetical protein
MEESVNFLDYFSPPKIVNEGTIIKRNGETVPYTIELGLSKSSIDECNKWKEFITRFILEFVDKNPSIIDYEEVLQNDIMLEDYHWNWLKKAIAYNITGYDWFFLKTPDGIQGICLTFHPKKSAIKSIDIFYIHYLASAPWNRVSKLYERKYKGVATEIIKQIQLYFIKTYQYSYGFSLHSLPQAETFYRNLGMKYFSKYDKDGLFFYEMDYENAVLLVGENYA